MISNAFNDDFHKGDTNMWDSIKNREVEETIFDNDELDKLIDSQEEDLHSLFDEYEIVNEDDNRTLDDILKEME